jgi:hypothetical protein
VGYRHWPGTACAFCGCDYMLIEDDSNSATYLVRCWCGAPARVVKDDPDLAQVVLGP